MKRTLITIIVAIIIMAGTASADLFSDIGNNRLGGSYYGSGGQSREILGGWGRINYNSRSSYDPYYNNNDRYSRQQPNIVSDALTGITTSEQPSLFGKSRLGEKNLEISRKAREVPPPTLQEMEEQVQRIKIAGQKKRENLELQKLEEKAKTLELKLKIAKLEKELEEAKKQ